jgi:putative tricarboxylic transport membrane protein
MERYDRIFSLIWIGLGVGQCVEAWRLGLGKVSEPETGFAPFVVGLLIILLSLFLLLESSVAIKKNPGKGVSIWSDVHWKRILSMILLLSAYALLLRKLGFLIDTFLLMTLLVKSGDRSKWPGAIVAGLSISVMSYIIFKVWLFVPFPEGVLGF